MLNEEVVPEQIAEEEGPFALEAPSLQSLERQEGVNDRMHSLGDLPARSDVARHPRLTPESFDDRLIEVNRWRRVARQSPTLVRFWFIMRYGPKPGSWPKGDASFRNLGTAARLGDMFG